MSVPSQPADTLQSQEETDFLIAICLW